MGDAPALAGYARVDGVVYELTVVDGRPGVTITSADDAVRLTLRVSDFDVAGRTRLTASEGGVLFGDRSRAWMVTPDGSARPLSGAVVHARLIGEPTQERRR